jgi:ATP-binding cassette, subfamily B, bacterial
VSQNQPSRQQYREFVEAYRRGTLGENAPGPGHDATSDKPTATPANDPAPARTSLLARVAPRGDRDHLRAYLRWLRPHRRAIATVFVLAVTAAGLQMIEPLFMRFIIDRVLLDSALDAPSRLARLNMAGALFLGAIVAANLFNMLKDYRQRLLNVRVMLSLRRTIFHRLLHLPLPALWEMKTGGILSRLTGDVDTTTGLLQMAVFAPALSVLRLLIAIVILTTINWRLALSSPAASARFTAWFATTSSKSTAASAKYSPASASSAPSAVSCAS